MGFRNTLRDIFYSSFLRKLFMRFDSRAQEMRRIILVDSLGHCGSNVLIQLPVMFCQPDKIVIDDDVSIAAFVHIWGAGEVTIGARTMIASHTVITTVTHDYTSKLMNQTVVTKPVFIEEDVWIGAHAIIFPGVTIGSGSVVGAGALVNTNVPSLSIVTGTPARVIGKRELL